MIRQKRASRALNSTTRRHLCLFCLVLCLSRQSLCLSDRSGPGNGPLFFRFLPQNPAESKTGDPDIVSLVPGQSVGREVSGEQAQSYQLTMVSGQFARFIVQQDGIDVVIRLFGPDSQLIGEVDDESRTHGQEVLELIADRASAYRIEVKPRYKFSPRGRYEIRLAELRAANENDALLDEARRFHRQASKAYLDGRYEEAIHAEQQCLSRRQQVLGPDDPQVASALFNLGLYYRNAGEIPEAEDAYLRALAIREKALGTDHPGVALALHNLGYLYYELRDYPQAESMYERALAIKKKALGPEHPLVAFTLGNLGLLQWKRKNYARAEACYRQAIDIFSKADGADDNSVATYTHDLGILYKESGDYVNAEAYYREALSIWEKKFGKDHPKVALALESLGILFRDQGDYQTAEPFLRRALDIEVRKEGANHPDVANTLVILARLYEAEGDTARAVELQSRAAEIEEKSIGRNLSLGSERRKLAYFSSMAKESDRRISLHARSAPGDRRARDLALTMVLQRKGRVLDALADTNAALRRGLSAQDQALLDNLNQTTAHLARLVLQGTAGGSAAEHENEVKTLEAEREQLEDELSRRTAGFYQPSHPATIDAIRDLVPDDAALIEFAVYHPSAPKAAMEHDLPDEPRYVAYVIRRRGEVEWRELGPAREIDSAVEAFRRAFADPQRTEVRKFARALDEKVLQPLRSSLGRTRRLLISPDGELNLVPFAALVDERGHYLLEHYSFTYLTSGRDLLRLRARRESKGPPVVIADPSYGAPALVAASAGGPGPGVGARFDYSQIFFTPLPGVAGEVRALRTILPTASFFTQEKATKAAADQLRGPAILHIATHGFFLRDDAGSAAEKPGAAQGDGATRVSKWMAHIENPLLRSGLALAGANQSGNGGNDGILTALELSGLDLWGTKLVVLSACDTGLGEVRNGQGVYGLRRALVLAGAESQIMSLWDVSDRSTRDLIIDYYRALMQGAGRGEALRKVQLQMLRDKKSRHPYYWAAFIQSGEWAGLAGKR